MKNAIVLCSGGLDSVTTSYLVKKQLNYHNIKILFFNYGQRSFSQERKCSQICSSNLKAEFTEINIPYLNDISTSLLNSSENVSEVNNLKNTSKESAKWYVPCRNLIFLSYALALAESLFIKEKQKYDIFVGFKNEGTEGFPDASKDFLTKINELSKISSKGNFEIISPLIEKDKEDIIILGEKIGVNFKDTFSCYAGGEKHCGICLACKLRKVGFKWADIKDSTEYLK